MTADAPADDPVPGDPDGSDGLASEGHDEHGRADRGASTGPWRWAGPALVVVVAAALGLATYLVGRDAGPDPVASHSSTIALGTTADTLWLTSPDDDAVVEVDAETLTVRTTIAVGGRPLELTRHADRLVVTRAQSDEIAVVALGATPRVADVEVPCGGTHSVVVAPEGAGGLPSDTAFVTCPTDDLVAVVDLAVGRTIAELTVGGRPTGVVSDGRQLTVSAATGAALLTWDLETVAGALATDPGGSGGTVELDLGAEVAPVWVDGERSASLLGPIALGPDGPVAPHQIVDNARQVTPEELAAGSGSYGTPLDGRARIEPALAGSCGGARLADFREPTRVLSGPVAVAAAPGSDLVWVLGQSSRSVAVVRCDGGPVTGLADVVARFTIGAGGRGIVVDPDGRRAWVDVGFDHAVARLDLPSLARERTSGDAEVPLTTAPGGEVEAGPVAAAVPTREPALVRRRETGPRYLTPLAEEGRRMFSDATDTHLTPQGVVSCASCHPSGGEDGLTWRIETEAIDAKVRRTPPVWALDEEAKPLHWDGGLATSEELVLQTIRELLGGDALLIDAAPITAYMAEVEAPPAAPVRTPEGRAAVARGRTLFHSDAAACASCHVAPLGTDGEAHAVLPPSADPAARLDAVVTPPLLGVRGRAPFGHDGRATSLRELLMDPDARHGGAESLSEAQLDDLIAYLRGL